MQWNDSMPHTNLLHILVILVLCGCHSCQIVSFSSSLHESTHNAYDCSEHVVGTWTETGNVGWLSMNECADGCRFIEIQSKLGDEQWNEKHTMHFCFVEKMLVVQIYLGHLTNFYFILLTDRHTFHFPFQNKLCIPCIVITCNIDLGCGRSSPWYIFIYDWKKRRMKTMFIPALNTWCWHGVHIN